MRETAGPILRNSAESPSRTGRERSSELHLQAQPHQAQADARLPEAHGDEGRPTRPESASQARPQASHEHVGSLKPEGFPREERVRRSADFTRILQSGERLRGRFLTAFWIREDQPVNRVGVAAGKRLGKAAVRNRLKRRLREAYRRNKRKLPCRGVAIIFMASPKMIGKSAADVEADVVQLLRTISDSLESRSGHSVGSSSSTGD